MRRTAVTSLATCITAVASLTLNNTDHRSLNKLRRQILRLLQKNKSELQIHKRSSKKVKVTTVPIEATVVVEEIEAISVDKFNPGEALKLPSVKRQPISAEAKSKQEQELAAKIAALQQQS